MIILYYNYVSQPPAYGSVTCGIGEPERSCAITTLPNECVWIVPGTMTPEDER